MSTKVQISASIVLYKENINELSETVHSFLRTPFTKKLFLIDNTPNKKFQHVFKQPEVEYIGLGKNIGFGAGHNKVLKKIYKLST